MSQPSQNPANQPISFKTVPGRNRTQKWSQAKTNNYDGDDWGGYDDYDDYGSQPEPTYAPQQPQQLQRQPSFDRGVDTERRQFSSGTAIHDSERYTSPSGKNTGQAVQDEGSPDETRRRMREFSNPGQVPQPLNTPRSPVAPGSVERPPRKSSLGSSSPDARPIPAATSPNADKPLPFIRPSDIYKRMAEEQQRERQSMESGRPSMDSVNRDAGSPSLSQKALSPQKSQSSFDRRPSLGPVSENMEPEPPAIPEQPLPSSAHRAAPIPTTVQPTDNPEDHLSRPSETSPRLPPVTRLSGFGSFMPSDEEERLSAVGLAASTAAANAAASALSSGSRDVTPTMPANSSYDDPDSPNQPRNPAAEIAAERLTDAPAEQLGRSADEDPSGLSHQPSSGFRSVVHKAFDNQGDGSIPASPISRDNTQSVVSRSDTNSTRSISPIMSRVPSAATAQQKQLERDAVVPPIAEETPLEVARSRPTQDTASPALSSRTSIMRKPTPSHSRNVSSEVVGFTPGYRRSMETPSPNNSPARTPALGDTDQRRFSGPMSAVTVNEPEAPDVDPTAPEMPSATLEPVETPSETPGSTYPGASSTDYVKPLPTAGRGRSGTDYSMRESDLAREANNSPETNQSLAEAATMQQNLFLDTHPSNPTSPTVLSPTTGHARPLPLQSSSGSGRNSPAGTSHSRVRNIVDQFHQIDKDSRRNSAASGVSSKSSWSNFAGDDEAQPGIPRRTTGGSALAGDATSPSGDLSSRPAAERLESFKPHLPGEWISAAPTPASEVPESIGTSTLRGRDQTFRDITPTPARPEPADQDEEVDLTPTTRKTRLQGNEPAEDWNGSQNPLSAVKHAGDALGTAFMSSMGYGHQTQDFASKDTAAPVDVPELRPHRETGNIDHYSVPVLRREDSDAPSDGTNSVANSVPPTPPEKDTPQPAGLAANAGGNSARPVSNYFAGYTPDAPAPLSFGKQSSNNPRDLAPPRPTVLPSLSTDTRATDFESDRLRKDIVRSLGPEQMADIKREGMLEETHRTQDALDAPGNERRVASGQSALPASEIKNTDARSGLPSQAARPGLLGQRFSWENRSTDSSSHMAVVGETDGDENRESYERPRSNQGLHVVNTQVVADSEPSTAEAEKRTDPPFMLNEPADAEQRLSTDLPVGTAALAAGNEGSKPAENIMSPIAESPTASQGGLAQVAPAPLVEDANESEGAREIGPQSPVVPAKDDSPTLSTGPAAAPQPSTAAQSKIPAFRDLATIKSTEDRIAAYESTRHRFADMNTGLSGWLSSMLAAHPEYANAGNQKYEGPAVIQTAGLSNTISGLGGTIRGASHKHSPSILKIGGERKASTTSTTAAAPTSGSSGGHADVEKMQAKGKDFMKSAGAGAKGLFAKGKSRFGRGGEKASSSVSSPLAIAPAFAPASRSVQPVENKPSQPTTEKPQPGSRPVTPTGAHKVGGEPMKDADLTSATNGAVPADRPRSVFGRLRSASRSDSNSKSRSGSIVFGSGFGDAGDRKSPGPSRSASRANSMVFKRGEAGAENRSTSPAPALPLPLPLTEPTDLVSDVMKQVPGTPGVLPGPSDRRREAWEDDDAEVGQAVWRDEHGRLGVLPSPSVQESVSAGRKGSWIGEPVVTPLEEVRGEEDAAAADSEKGELLAKPEPVTSATASTAQEDVRAQETTPFDRPAHAAPVTTEPETTTTDVALPVRRSSLQPVKNRDPSPERVGTSYTLPSPPMARPAPERKFSALDELPSQQRRRQYTPVATPRKMSLADGEMGDPLPNSGAMPAQGDSTPQTKPSRPATPANWDKLSFVSPPKKAGDSASRRSSVSSLGNSESHDTILKSGAASKRHSVVGMLDSSAVGVAAPDDQRRSVSPLPIEPSAAGPQNPTSVSYSMPANGSAETGDFMNRTYQSSQPREQRPVSYMAHSRKSSGVSHQDVVNMQQANKRYSTGAMPADYAVPSVPVYQQQPAQPLSRAPSLGHPPSEYDRLRSPQAGDADNMVGDTSSRRSSGFFRGPEMSTGGLGTIPSPSKIDDNYNGLVNPQGSEMVDDMIQAEQQEQQQPQQPQKKRKSGIMDSFRRASSFHSNANTSSRPSSYGSLPLAVAAANNSNESALAKTKTLKKPQRAPPTAVEPLKAKSKRFSTLGSIFRRSSSQVSPRVNIPAEGQSPVGPQSAAAATPPRESKKLRKSQPPQQYQQQPHQQQYPQRPAQYYAGPPPGNYAAYEAMMRQQAPMGVAPDQSVPSQYWQQQQQQQQQPEMMSSPYQQRPAGYYQQGPPQGQYQQQYQISQPNSRTHSLVGSPVAGNMTPSEYYAVASAQPGVIHGQATSPPPGEARPQARRLHSEGHRRRDTVPGIPEANSPVNSSNPDEQAEIGVAHASPPRTVPSPARPTITTRQSSMYSQSSVVASPVATQTAPDNFPQAPGRQDYQTQYWQHQHQTQPARGSNALPPLQTQPQPIRQQSGDINSIDQQVARSPALDYQHHQQTPWSISLPQAGEDNSSNRNCLPQQQAPPFRSPQATYNYTGGPPAAARGAVRSSPPAHRYQDQYSAMKPYHFVPPQQIQNIVPQPRSSHHYGENGSSPVDFSAPPSQAQAQTFTPAQHYQNAYGVARPQQQQQRIPISQTRYYGHQQQQQQEEARPLSYQRSPSGYSGRRDDAAVSEAELMNMNTNTNTNPHMRGSSYPGQEWVPGRN